MNNIILAVSRMSSACGELEKNLEQSLLEAKLASDSGAKILCFPELSLTGYCLEHARCNALEHEHAALSALRQAAVKDRITLLCGAAEKDGDLIYDTHFVFGSNGSVSKYRKTHLGGRESLVFSAGDELPVFEAEGLCFGIEICFDSHFPEVSSVLSSKGASVIFAPFAVPERAGARSEIWNKYMGARAYDSRTLIACCNPSGENGCGNSFSGNAALYWPDGIKNLSPSPGSGLVVVEMNLDDILSFRGAAGGSHLFFPALRRPEIYF